jgi:hypothetical protein
MAAFFESNDVQVFILGSGLRPVATAAARLLSSPHPILYDQDRSTYRAYGLEKRMGLIQMSGTFIVDPHGVLDYTHAALNPFDAFHKREITERIEFRSQSGGKEEG